MLLNAVKLNEMDLGMVLLRRFWQRMSRKRPAGKNDAGSGRIPPASFIMQEACHALSPALPFQKSDADGQMPCAGKVLDSDGTNDAPQSANFYGALSSFMPKIDQFFFQREQC
ncbi:hypothetical protein [uncultured Mailhella sp.]|uniref:hypothetical protein n=1 Tax=uncultured Mailhella sp. TaxID=1981031 RepID=UPI003209C2DB